MGSPASIIRWTGFKSRSARRYYLILSSISVIFILLRARSVSVDGHYCSSAGEPSPIGDCYWYMQSDTPYYLAIRFHLASCLPALGLAIVQFTPSVRQKFPAFHRWAGRLCMLLAFTATITGLVLGEIAFGGTKATLSGATLLAILSLTGHFKAWTAIRQGNLHLHRRWMLRTWSWLGAIISMRPIVVLGALFVSVLPTIVPYIESTILCRRLLHTLIRSTFGNDQSRINIFEEYPSCLSDATADITVARDSFSQVIANGSRNIPTALLQSIDPEAAIVVRPNVMTGKLHQLMAAADISFGPAIWIAIIIHVVLVELYIRRTWEEDLRLQKVSELRRKSKMK